MEAPSDIIFSKTVERRKKSLKIWYVLGALALALLAGAVYLTLWRASGSFDREVESAIAEGRLAYPIGASLVERTQAILEEKGVDELGETGQRIAQAADSALVAHLNSWHDLSEPPPNGWQEVQRLAELQLLVDPQSSQARSRSEYAQGQAAFDRDSYSEALDHFRRALQTNPQGTSPIRHNWDLAFNGIGKSCWRLKDTGCAIENYSAAIRANPSWVFPYLNLAGVYFETGRLGEAEEYYRRAIAVAPERSSTHYLFAEFLYSRRRFSEARSHYEQSINLRPTDTTNPTFSQDQVRQRIEWLRARGY